MRLEELVRRCTVKLSSVGMKSGTGFFIAPGYILTCEHVVRDAGASVQVRWQQQEAFAEAKVLKTFPDCDVALLSFEQSGEGLPCVYFDEGLPDIEDRLYLFGYGNTSKHGDPVIVQVEGMTGDVPPLIKYRLGSIKPGMSGAALVNCRTGKVCGMSKFTVDKYYQQGGGGIPLSTLMDCLSFNVVKAQQQFHDRDRRWSEAQPLTAWSQEKDFNPSGSENDTASGESNQQSTGQGNTQIIQDVKQNGEKNINIGQASSVRIGDDY